MTTKERKKITLLLMYDQIQDYLRQGYSLRWISHKLQINYRTLKKYKDMSREEYETYVSNIGTKPYSLEPYKDFIVKKLGLFPETSSAQMHDWLKEAYSDFPVTSPRTVYNYVMKVRQDYGIAKISLNKRQYSAIPDAGAGQYAQVDFGQKKLRTGTGGSKQIYFMAMLLCHSRYKYVWFREKPFTSHTAVTAHEKAFEYFHGVPHKIIYDQDAVFLYDENIGDYVMTTVFDSYVKSCVFKPVFCRPADPESKGKVENVIKYVKQNFLQNRPFTTIEDLNEEVLKWLQRTGNAMVHNTTCKIPFEEWKEECRHLLPYIPITIAVEKKGYKVLKNNTIRYKNNFYSVPLGTYVDEQSRVFLNEENESLVIMDPEGVFIARHVICAGKGTLITNKSHRRDRSSSTQQMREAVENLFNDREEIHVFLNRVQEAYPRYMRDQLATLLECYDTYGATACQQALSLCTTNHFKSANDFKALASAFGTNDLYNKKETVSIKPLGDASARMMANIEPNRSSIEDYQTLFGVS